MTKYVLIRIIFITVHHILEEEYYSNKLKITVLFSRLSKEYRKISLIVSNNGK